MLGALNTGNQSTSGDAMHGKLPVPRETRVEKGRSPRRRTVCPLFVTRTDFQTPPPHVIYDLLG